MEATGKKALVFGTGISGTGAAKLLRAQKAEVILYDGNEDLDKERLRESFGRDEKVEIIAGELPERLFGEVDLVILSPGVPADFWARL